jgi:asparagine synthase (glutamine-hydrolysing)
MIKVLAVRIVRKLRRLFMPPIIKAVRADALTFLEEDALYDLYNLIARLERACVEGILIEAGCALGGSAIVIAAAKSKSRPFYVYDMFGMIPPPTDKDSKAEHERYEEIRSGKAKGLRGKKYYGYEENLIDKVAENFRTHGFPIENNNIHFVKGLFQETMLVQDKVAFAHIDCDWYESVMTCLRQIEPWLIPGGVLVIDDYPGFSGCRIAVDEYFGDKKDKYDFIQKARLHIIRK